MVSCLYSSSEGGSAEGNLDYDPYLTNDSGITEDEPATLEEGLLYVTKVPTLHHLILCAHQGCTGTKAWLRVQSAWGMRHNKCHVSWVQVIVTVLYRVQLATIRTSST